MLLLGVRDWLLQNGPAVSSMAAVVTATVAVASLTRTTRDSRRSVQPSMVAELAPVPHVRASQTLIVRNVGQTPATEVSVSFNVELPTGEDDGKETLIAERYSRPIPTIAPGQALSNVWYWAVPGEGGRLVNHHALPDRFAVSFRYRGVGRKWLTSSYVLDVDVLRKETEVTSSVAPDEQIKAIRKALDQIAKKIK